METFKQVISMGRDKLISGIKYVYSDINPSTLTGAIDVIIVEQMDGSFICGPFHVRFGKMGTLKPADKIVDIRLNGKYLEHLHMKLGSAGEAYFIETVEESNSETLDSSLVVSPFHSDNEEADEADLSNTRLSAKKRLRKNLKVKTDLFVKNEAVDGEIKENIYQNQYQCLSDNDDFNPDDNLERVREGYNSDGAVDKITKEELNDINMTWDWGTFPLDIRAANEKPADIPEKSLEMNPDLKKPKEKPVEVGKSEKSVKGRSPSEEIYLEDIVASDISEELKRTYLYTDDNERISKKAGSKRMELLDNTVAGNDAGYRSDGESSVTAQSPTYPVIHELKFSLCGDISINDKISEQTFFQNLVSFEDFIRDPDELLKNANLVVLLNGKYYNWSVAAPMILSIIAFQSELPAATVNTLKNTYMAQKKRRSTWFSWRRQEAAAVVPDSKAAPVPSPSSSPPKVEQVPPQAVVNETTPMSITPSSLDTNEDVVNHNKLYMKKIRLSSKEVGELDLVYGRNEVVFSMTTKYQGTTCCQAAIYLWKWYDKIVISDVDGTITKSDVLGHVLPILGRDWTQAGVAKLYNKICQNNYRFIYLSARAIGQAGITRTLLKDIVQETSDKLPLGPILLSPTSLFQSLHREVIEKKPEYFKIQCLNDVRSLFPENAHPLYAGFGNRVNDVIAYKAVGIDPKRIFTVNPEGSLKNEYCQKWSTSYGNLFDVADHFFQFQSTIEKSTADFALADYIDVNYWSMPINEIEIREEINKSSKSANG